ncbi:MAG: hypothetical protein MZV64_32895 [Ignavibacteriales bacterium]|nr:hypothetical protein [Ignavibacteriales bacterium]
MLASFGLISDVQGDVYDIFTNAEKPFPKSYSFPPVKKLN